MQAPQRMQRSIACMSVPTKRVRPASTRMMCICSGPSRSASPFTPVYVGIENAGDLPNAATFCGECQVVCPVKIPLPDLMRKLREQQFDRKLRPFAERFVIDLWSFAVKRPKLYATLTRIGARIASWMGGRDKLIHRLPGIDGWTHGRDMPAPEGKTFRELYRERRR